MLKWLTASKAERIKLDKISAEILDLQGHKKGLEIENQQAAQLLNNTKREHEMQAKEAQHKFKLEMQEQKAEFERAKKIWEEDKQRLEAKLKAEYEIKQQELVALTKLDSEQKIKQAELNHTREINELKAKHTEEMANFKQKTLEENYKTLSASLADLHAKGNVTTEFMRDLTMKMLEKTGHVPGANVLLTGGIADARVVSAGSTKQ